MSSWNPLQYEKFLKDRTRPSHDLAQRLQGIEVKKALDLGCGPGNSTKVVSEMFPHAVVQGADISEEMLARARMNCPGIAFFRLDASGDLHEAKQTYDLVFSNACLQWIPNHRQLLPKLMTLLNPGGILAVQIPIQRVHPVHILLHSLVQTEKWCKKLTPRPYNNLLPEEYYDLLSEVSADFELWETVYYHRMPDHESILEWYKGAGMRPYLEQLGEEDAAEFTRDFLCALKEQYPIRKNGEILFRFPRFFFIAKKAEA